MKYVKILSLLAVAAAALMAFAGTASATTLTYKTGNGVIDVLPVGSTIHAESEGATSLTGTVTITCQKSTVHGTVTDEGGSGKTVKGSINSLTFTECGNSTVTVVKPGTLEVHTEFESTGGTEHETAVATGNGTLTSSGAVVTVLLHSFLLGTVHCTYVTNNTDIGKLTGSKNTKATATLDITSQSIPKDPETSDGPCGNHATWEGSYKVNTPDYLDVD